ncbi:DNA methylase [alpha proteobacterium U9-1i]|nr:DNA methylase [alpha proteobacterium U9-1i]
MSPREWLRARAKAMRSEMTPHEKAMWRLLHEGELVALSWRRQAAFGSAILDFVSHPARLVIEVDGAQHATLAQSEHDALRTAWLEREGYRVLRFWNTEAISERQGVWETIHNAASETSAYARMLRWRNLHDAQIRERNAQIASPSMGEAPRSGGGGARASVAGEPQEAKPEGSRATPPQSALRADSSPIEGERGS